MVHTGHCRNCGVSTSTLNDLDLCNICKDNRRRGRCYRYLPDHLYTTADCSIRTACQNQNENNVGRYCLDRIIGDRTWRGAADDVDVSNFIQQHQSDITITFETARSENEVIKYYFCLLYTSPSPRDRTRSRMPSSA